MTPKLFYGLTLAAAVSLAVAGTSYYSTRTWAPGATSGEALFANLAGDAGKVASVRISQGKQIITVKRDGDAWSIVERNGFPANTEEVRQTIVGLTRMDIIEEKTRNETRYKLLQLEDPEGEDAESKLVVLADESGKEIASVVLGKVKLGVLGPGRNGTYVRKPGTPQTWLVSGNVDAPINVRGWAEKTIYEISKDDIAQIRISHPDNEDVLLTHGKGETGAFTLANLPEGKKLKQDADLGFIATSLVQLELWDVKKRSELEADPEKTVVVEIVTRNGLNLMVNVRAGEGEDRWVDVSAEGGEGVKDIVADINSRTAGWTFKIQEYKAGNFLKRLDDLVEPEKQEGDS